MILDSLSARWAAVAPALGDHLWQSTVFVILAGLLALLLRKNQARFRYWLWFAASVKFLIPFSLLVGLGTHLAPPRGPAGKEAGFYLAIEQVGQPFTPAALPANSHSIGPAVASSGLVHLLPLLLSVAWLCGFVTVLVVWYARWRQVAVVLREAEPLQAGRELTALRRLERLCGARRPLQIMLTQTSLEPGICGIVRPVLLWPAGISERLGDAHLEAILAHELRHVRRRDNLAAALHMLVEAIFWFHPFVWWLGTQLVDARERACDEEVLSQGSQRQVYAESILKTCAFCMEAPLACVSGVTGADLKKRIVRIMTHGAAARLSFARKLLLAASAATSVAGPVIFGLLLAPLRAQSAQPEGTPMAAFDVASVKPDHMDGHHTRLSFNENSLLATGMSLKRLIAFAYNVNDFQVFARPSWVDSETYEVQATIDQATVEALKKLPREQRGEQHLLMVQALLAERFKLKVSRSSKEFPIYALVLTKNGPKFPQPAANDKQQNLSNRNGDLSATAESMSGFAKWLSSVVGRKVVDQTGLTGKYDFAMTYDHRKQDLTVDGPGAAAADSSGPSIFTALQEQLGLKLEPKKGAVETLIIDSAEKPSAN